MKRLVIYLPILVSALSLVLMPSCNPEPENEVAEVRKWLESDDWLMYKSNSGRILTYKDREDETYSSNGKEISSQELYVRANSWRFRSGKWQKGIHYKGEFEYGDKYRYSLSIDESGKIKLDLSQYDENLAEPNHITRTIEGFDTDTLFIKEELTHIGDTSGSIPGMYATAYKYHEYYFKRLDLVSYYDSINNRNHLLQEQAGVFQKKIKGEWYSEKRVVVTEYEEGYAADNGETHTESTITYSGAYPALKINCEHVPATENQPSTFRKGTYSNGNATYDITPAKYNMDDEQQYIVSMDDDENFNVFFRCYQPQLLQNGKYTLSGFAPVVQTPTEDSMIMVADSLSYFYTQGVYSKMVITSRSRITEYWRRQ